MYIDAADGRGCDHCEVGYPITYTATDYGIVKKCLECTLYWFGWTVEQFETRHRPFRDHLGDALTRAYDLEIERGRQAMLTAE